MRVGFPSFHGNGANRLVGDRYLVVFVDVNGKSGSNIAGKDVHAFIYTRSDGLIPAGVDANSNDTSNNLKYNCP